MSRLQSAASDRLWARRKGALGWGKGHRGSVVHHAQDRLVASYFVEGVTCKKVELWLRRDLLFLSRLKGASFPFPNCFPSNCPRRSLEQLCNFAVVRAVDVQQHVKPLVVAGLHEMCELVSHDVIKACRRISGQRAVDADGPGFGCARAPARFHAANLPARCVDAHCLFSLRDDTRQLAGKFRSIQRVDAGLKVGQVDAVAA